MSVHALEGSGVSADGWQSLAALTDARIALGRAGSSLPTRETLRFALDHARARDAVHAPLDPGPLKAALEALCGACLQVKSAAADRACYLQRPDLGRRLSDADRAALTGPADGFDVAFVLGDGLSAEALQRHALPLLESLWPALRAQGLRLAPPVLAEQARVALGDEVGERLGARLVVVLLGERPGLSSPDSLGAYLTAAPRAGLSDAARNCVSNIRPAGLAYALAAYKLCWLIEAGLQGGTGVALKDQSEADPAYLHLAASLARLAAL